MNSADLPAPPPVGGPMTKDEVIHAISDYWVDTLNATEEEALMRGERAFDHLLLTGFLREWGVTNDGWLLYEPTTPVAQQTIVYVTRKGRL